MATSSATGIDLNKRRRVMDRSRKLGHCVCDPRRSCPCDVFRNQGLCPCAGERPAPVEASKVRLTQMVHSPGCASKIPPAQLEAILARLPAVNDPAVLSGLAAGDDAGIYRLPTGEALVQTVDVMTPVVDDPHLFGRICATNCLSDIYAMGGTPRTALSVVAFPADTLDGTILYRMLAGAMEVLAGAGVALIGGHSLQDAEIKLGFAITGTIDPKAATSHETARPGDVLVLTKPLGTGVVGFCRQIGRAIDTASAEAGMTTLNRDGAAAAAKVGVSACTDVTGFGLLGHLARMVRHSAVTAELSAAHLPALPGVLEALRDDVVPGAVERNREFVGDDLEVRAGADEAAVLLGLDAQTSGGLLLAVPQDRHAALLVALKQAGCGAWTIGKITAGAAGRIVVHKDLSLDQAGGSCCETAAVADSCCGTAPESCSGAAPAGQACCGSATAVEPQAVTGEPRCASAGAGAGSIAPAAGTTAAGSAASECGPSLPASAGEAAISAQAFGQLMASTMADGELDARTKGLINYALAVMSRCSPCVEALTNKALRMGLTSRQLEEAAWCAVAMGGAPVKMFAGEAVRAAKAGGTRGCCP